MATATARLQAMTPNRPERKRSVYLIKIGEMFKIGLSVDPVKRIRGMQLPNKPDWVRAYEVPCADELEKNLHKRFRSKREYGEWFLLTADDVAQVERICKLWTSVKKRTGRNPARVYPIGRKK